MRRRLFHICGVAGAVAALLVPASASASPMSEVSTATVPFLSDEGNFVSALISPDGSSVYFGSGLGSGSAVRLATSPLAYASDKLSGLASERAWATAVRSPNGAFGYWGAYDGSTPRVAQVIKVDLAAMSRVASVPLLGTPVGLISAAGISPDGTYGYFATYDETASGSDKNKLVRMNLTTMASPASPKIDLPAEDLNPTSVLVQPDGHYAFLGCDSGRIVKVDLQTMARVGSIDLSSDGFFRSGAISSDGRFGYFATRNNPAKVVKVDLDSFSKVGSAVSLGAGNTDALVSAISPDGSYGYFGTNTSPGRVVRVNLSSMTVDSALTLGAGKDTAASMAVSPDGQFAYVGTYTFNPAKVVKVKLADKNTLTVTRDGAGSGTVTGAGGAIDCGTACTTSRLDYQDLAISLVATPSAGSAFSGWAGACSGTGTCTVTLDQARDVAAIFSLAPTPSPSPTPGSSLSVARLTGRPKRKSIAVTSTATVSGAGRLSQVATQKVGRKTVRRCSVTRDVGAAGTYPLVCRVGSKGRAALRRARMNLRVLTTFAPASGSPVGRTLALKLKRRR